MSQAIQEHISLSKDSCKSRKVTEDYLDYSRDTSSNEVTARVVKKEK